MLKKITFSVLMCLGAWVSTIQAQAPNCSDLFIATYIEGYGNNRALEIYNPTNTTIDLSQYQVGRFRDGATVFTGVQLSADMIQPYHHYTVVLDQRNAQGTGTNVPVWNGYLLVDTLKDRVTGLPILDGQGHIQFGVQYDATGGALYGTVYHDSLDLQGRANTFQCPDYNTNSAMYFNGNDGAALIKGTSVLPDGSNILDMVGVVGIDPGAPGWLTNTGGYLTKDRTLKRLPSVLTGTGPVVNGIDTFNYSKWTVFPKNTFTVLDAHSCLCDPAVGTHTVETTAVNVTLFPNPAKDGQFTVIADGGIQQLEVFNLLGQSMLVRKMDGITRKSDVQLNAASGIYVLDVMVGNQHTIKKVTVE